jgi:hypothetical protein
MNPTVPTASMTEDGGRRLFPSLTPNVPDVGDTTLNIPWDFVCPVVGLVTIFLLIIYVSLGGGSHRGRHR